MKVETRHRCIATALLFLEKLSPEELEVVDKYLNHSECDSRQPQDEPSRL